jgi:hypothetical protein
MKIINLRQVCLAEHVTRRIEMSCEYNSLMGNVKWEVHLEDAGVDGRIWNWVLKK